MARSIVLIVDNHDDTGELLGSVVAGMGLEPIIVKSVAESRALIAERPVNIAIIDFGLPDGTALDVLDALGEATEAASVLLTAYPLGKVDVRRFGVAIEKPFALSELRDAISRVLVDCTAGSGDRRERE